MQLSKAISSGLAFDPQHPLVAKRQFEIMAGLVGAADLP